MTEEPTIKSKGDLARAYNRKAQNIGLTCDVLGDGLFTADTAIVAEAPGEREMQLKMPLVGGSGKFLWQVLNKQGVNRNTCYVTNVIKRQISLSSKANIRADITKHEVSHWQSLLLWELSQLPNLKYIIVLGNYALEAICGVTHITKRRGSVFTAIIGGRECKVLCTYNPALVLREPKSELVFRFDLGKFPRIRTGKYPVHAIRDRINPSPAEALQWLEKMHDERLPVSVDIETISGETACIGFANDPHEGMCINFRTKNANRYSLQEEREIRQSIQRLFMAPASRFVGQNLQFDMYWMWYKDRLRIKPWFDTLLAHHTLYPTLPHGLDFLTTQYTTHPYYKDERTEWREGGDIDTFWTYNVKDVCITLTAQQKLLTELEEANMDKFFFNHVMRLQPHTTRATVMGIKVDAEYKEQVRVELEEQVGELLSKFYSLVEHATGDPDYHPNPASPTQMRDLYFRKLKLIGRGVKVDAENRNRMRDHPRTPPFAKQVLDAHDEYAKEQKFYSTYANARLDPDGRFRCEYKQYGTQKAPGRLSSSQVMWGTGGNLQNQPERAQPMYIADEGYCFVYFDLSQAEARYVAWEANIPAWKAQFEKARIDRSYDCHRALASEMWHIPYEEVPEKDTDPKTGERTIRYTAKRCRHGLNYRMGADRLATTTGLSLSEASAAYRIYHKTTPRLQEWWKEEEDEVRKTKMLFNCFGRRLVILERITDEALESIIAFKPQSSIGDKVSSVWYLAEADDAWPKHDARIILNVHDALIAICRIGQEMAVARIMQKYAEAPLIVRGEKLIIPAEFKVSYPSVPQQDENGKVTFVRDDVHGVHRWGVMQNLEGF